MSDDTKAAIDRVKAALDASPELPSSHIPLVAEWVPVGERCPTARVVATVSDLRVLLAEVERLKATVRGLHGVIRKDRERRYPPSLG